MNSKRANSSNEVFEQSLDHTAAALNRALTAVENLTALSFEATHLSTQAFSRVSSNVDNPVDSFNSLLGLTRSLLVITESCNDEITRLIQAQLHDLNRSLDFLREREGTPAFYGGEGGFLAVQELLRVADAALEAHKTNQSSLVER